MILRFFSQPDSPHSQIFRKAGQKKTEPNRTSVGVHVSRAVAWAWAWSMGAARASSGVVASTVSSGGKGENEERVRERARAGRGRGLSVQFIEDGRKRRGGRGEREVVGVFKLPSIAFINGGR
jgi:hypothetical protein